MSRLTQHLNTVRSVIYFLHLSVIPFDHHWVENTST